MKVQIYNPSSRIPIWAAMLWTMLSGPALTLAGDSNAPAIEFNRDIRPILSDKCFTCHGPDKANRTSSLRFDTEDGAFQDLGGGRFAIVAGEPAKSEMVRRISADDEAVRMPPASAGRPK